MFYSTRLHYVKRAVRCGKNRQQNTIEKSPAGERGMFAYIWFTFTKILTDMHR